MNKDLQKLFLRYLQGTLSGDEESGLIDWIKSSDKNVRYFKKYIFENQYSHECSPETNAAWERISSKLQLHVKLNKASGKKIIFPDWVKVAALIVVAFVSGVLINNIYQGRDNDHVFNQIIVPKGEKSQLILSDGSKVFLNSDTYLKYPSVFTQTERKVILSGEAFFEIEKDPSHPFIVETNKFNVKVTGTSFNLSAYNEDEASSVTLHSGKVTVEKNGFECKINPGEKYVLTNRTNKYKVVQTDITESSKWKNDVIVIDYQNLEEIRKVLERNFNVTIKIEDENLKNIRYTGQFKPHETLEEIFALIKDASPIKFKVEFNKTKDYVTIKLDK